MSLGEGSRSFLYSYVSSQRVAGVAPPCPGDNALTFLISVYPSSSGIPMSLTIEVHFLDYPDKRITNLVRAGLARSAWPASRLRLE